MFALRLKVSLRLLMIGLHLLNGAFQVAILFRFADKSLRQELKRRWSRQLVGLLGLRIEYCAEEIAACQHGLMVANHISFIDIFVLNALLPSGFVAKSDVMEWPLIGWLGRHNDTVFIERGNHRAAYRTRQQMLDALAAGNRLAIFPEGTTTTGDRVLPFHGALFQSAVDAEVPVHALALGYRDEHGARSDAPAYIDDLSLLDCLKNVLQKRGLVARVTLAARFVPPLPDRRHLAHRAHQAIATALADSTERHPSRLQQADPGNSEENHSAAPRNIIVTKPQ